MSETTNAKPGESARKVALLHAQGMTDLEVGATLGVSFQYAKRLRKGLDLPANRKGDRVRAAIARLHAEGLSDGDIVTRLRLSYSHVKTLRQQLRLAPNGEPRHANVERGQRTRAEIARLHKLGRDPSVIAAALGLTPIYVRSCMRRDGLVAAAKRAGAKAPDGMSRAERGAHNRAEVARLRAQGLGGAEIAERLGLSRDYVGELMAEIGRPAPAPARSEAAATEEDDGEMPRWWRKARRACAQHLDDLHEAYPAASALTQARGL